MIDYTMTTRANPFSENAMLVTGPTCPWKLATFEHSFKSQILTTLNNTTEL